MSPFLFNVVLDACFTKLSSDLGVDVDGKGLRLTHLAFADDVAIVAPSAPLLQMLLDEYVQALAQIGLEINAGMCKSYEAVIDRSRDGSTWHINSEPSLIVAGERIPALSRNKLYKYLGVNVGVDPRVERAELVRLTLTTFRQEINNVSAAPLKPSQRVRILVEHLLPRHDHRLALSKTPDGLLDDLDKLVRGALCKWLHLPRTTAMEYLHKSWRVGSPLIQGGAPPHQPSPVGAAAVVPGPWNALALHKEPVGKTVLAQPRRTHRCK